MTTEGTPNPAPEGGKPAEGAPAANGGAPATGGEKPPEVVIPDTWKKEGAENEFDIQTAAKEYADLRKQIDASKAPDQYEVVVPEGIDPAVLPKDDPLLAAFHTVAKKHNLSQAAVNETVAEVVKFQSAVLASFRENTLSELGKDGPELVSRVNTWAKSVVQGDEYEALQIVATSAAGIRALDKLRAIATKESKIPTDAGNGISSELTRAEVDAMMKSDDYWNNSSPNYKSLRDKVTQFFSKQK